MNLLQRILQLDLFGDLAHEVPLTAPTTRRPRSFVGGWEVADHACRHCLGRVLQRKVKGVAVEVRCAECGAHAEGVASAICCCGAECGTLGHILECFRNPDVSAAVPQEILVRERPVEDKPEARRQAKPVGMKNY